MVSKQIDISFINLHKVLTTTFNLKLVLTNCYINNITKESMFLNLFDSNYFIDRFMALSNLTLHVFKIKRLEDLKMEHFASKSKEYNFERYLDLDLEIIKSSYDHYIFFDLVNNLNYLSKILESNSTNFTSTSEKVVKIVNSPDLTDNFSNINNNSSKYLFNNLCFYLSCVVFAVKLNLILVLIYLNSLDKNPDFVKNIKSTIGDLLENNIHNLIRLTQNNKFISAKLLYSVYLSYLKLVFNNDEVITTIPITERNIKDKTRDVSSTYIEKELCKTQEPKFFLDSEIAGNAAQKFYKKNILKRDNEKGENERLFVGCVLKSLLSYVEYVISYNNNNGDQDSIKCRDSLREISLEECLLDFLNKKLSWKELNTEFPTSFTNVINYLSKKDSKFINIKYTFNYNQTTKQFSI